MRTPYGVGYASPMTTTKNTAEATATSAQSARIALIRKEIKATGNRITLAKLGGGFIRVTEYDKATGERASLTMNLDGEYV